jgi:Fe-S cluster biogenesis protein NfuA
MSLFDTLRNAFGIQRPLRLQPSDTPLALSDSARARIAELDDEHGIHVTTSPSEGGFVVVAQEGASQGPPPPGFDDLPLSVADRDLHRLRGLTLDYRDGRWAISLDLAMRARETPNPDSRLYLCNRLLATGRPLYFTQSEGSPALIERLLDIPAVEAILLRDNTVTVERTPSAPWDPIDAAVDAAVREYFLLCGHEIDGSALKTSDDPFEQEVLAVLAKRVLPGIHQDGGDLDLLGIDNGVVRVSLQGACRSCPASTATLKHGIERTLREAFPGRIERVEQV